MSSLIPGYNYDIFISYRQKDNKGEKWVSEFVEALKTELESTFKEQISVYFDINPSDYLLESYDVDASLKDKLKCLVFIPIISRTYCDSKSFAWVHEFKAFVEMASKDQYGLKIKLPNGNVASRVLPVRIHGLDEADLKECESVLGGVLRGIEFIYKEAGIDKPLSPGDNEKKNLNNTTYRIQIIKVAHSIKEIIFGMKNEPVIVEKEKEKSGVIPKEINENEQKVVKEKWTKAGKIKYITAISVLTMLIFAGTILYPRIFKIDTLEKLKVSGEIISVAVMPFQNMTNDTAWNVWQDGIQNELINYLTNSEELKVRQTESITALIQSKGLTGYPSLTPSVASMISKKLDANVFIIGSIKQVSEKIRVNAQLIDTKTQDIFKSFQIDGKAESILNMTDSLSKIVRDYLIVSILGKEVPSDFKSYVSTNSPEAYGYYIYGMNAFTRLDFPTARNWMLLALAIDSNFFMPAMQIAFTYGNAGIYDQAKIWCSKYFDKRDQMPLKWKIMTEFTYATYFGTPQEEIKILKQILELDDQLPAMHWQLGDSFRKLYQWDKAIQEFEKSLELFKKLDIKPFWVLGYTFPGLAYHETGQYNKEKKLYKKAEQDFPDDPLLIVRQAILALTEGKTKASSEYIEKYKTIRKNQSWPEASIVTSLAGIYSEAKILDKAEEFYRKALSLEPKSQGRINTLAYFLIDKDRNADEGMELVNKVLETSPDNFNYLHTKGWGLYKKGKYQEALNVLQKSWDIRREKAIYNHEAFLHLEAAKKAVESMK